MVIFSHGVATDDKGEEVRGSFNGGREWERNGGVGIEGD